MTYPAPVTGDHLLLCLSTLSMYMNGSFHHTKYDAGPMVDYNIATFSHMIKEMLAHPDFQREIVADEQEFLDMNATRILMFDHQIVQIGKDYKTEWIR
jgi:hypothetical protein